MEIITIKELKEKLSYTDLRAVRNWCKKNDVLIVKLGKLEFVYETDFVEVIERPFINKLKNKFGKDWEEAYRLYKDGNVSALNTLHEIPDIKYKSYKSDSKVFNAYNEKYKSIANRNAA